MIGRAKTKTNHIGRDGLKTSKYFAGKKGSHIAMRHLGNNEKRSKSHKPPSDGLAKTLQVKN